MSKRFGRNQRRRAREALQQAQDHASTRIGELSSVLETARTELINRAAKLKEAEDFTREVAAIVGRESIIAGHETPLNVGMSKDEAVRYGVRFSPRQEFPSISLTQASMSIEQVRYEILSVLDVKAVREMMRQCVTLRVQFNDRVMAYSLSQSAIARMTPDELNRRLIPEIARDISTALTNKLKEVA